MEKVKRETKIVIFFINNNVSLLIFTLIFVKILLKYPHNKC